ncbi:MAG: PQQ-binding-like beta-propeller repeat protein [Armatimonadetes bacterium]|nr:PQQ-binding-like beta-propeller repeat protein [Armatimonadota bacterium]
MRRLLLFLVLLAPWCAGCAMTPDATFKLPSTPISRLVEAEGSVYYIDREGSLHAIELATGKERWKHGSSFLDAKIAPAASEGRVFVTSEKGKGLALDAQNGKVLWSAGGSSAKTVLGPLPKGQVAAVQGADLLVLDAASGKQLRRQHLGSEGLSPPLYHQGMLYAIRKDTTPQDVEWDALRRTPTNVVCAYTSAQLNLQWTNQLASTNTELSGGDQVLFVTAPTTYDDPLAPLVALDLRTGRQRWEMAEPETTAKRNKWFPKPPLSKGGKAFVNMTNGVDVYLIAVEESSGKVAWQSPNLGPDNGEVGASTRPAMEGGKLVLGVERQLFVFDPGSGKRRSVFEADGTVADPPLVGEAGLYVGTTYPNLYRFSK